MIGIEELIVFAVPLGIGVAVYLLVKWSTGRVSVADSFYVPTETEREASDLVEHINEEEMR